MDLWNCLKYKSQKEAAMQNETKKDVIKNLWHRLKNKEKIPRRWWCPGQKKNPLSKEETLKQLEETSLTIRRVMMSIIVFCFFSVVVLGTPDYFIFAGGEGLKIPLANITVSFRTFLFLGPLILFGVLIYLQIFIDYNNWLRKDGDINQLPFLFNMNNWTANALSYFIFYPLVPLVMFLYYWKAQPLGGAYGNLLLAISTCCILIWMQIRRCPLDKRRKRCPFLWGIFWFFILVALFSIQYQKSVNRSFSPFYRTLKLADADFHNMNLRSISLFRADLSGANLKSANLGYAKLQYANLSSSDFSQSNLERADLKGANLSKACLKEANLKFAKLTRASLDKVNLQGANLYRSDFTQTKRLSPMGIRLAINWNLAYYDNEFLRWLQLPQDHNRRLMTKNFAGYILCRANFSNVDLSDANLENADLREANFMNAELKKASFRGADLRQIKNLKIEQLPLVETLYKAKLEPELEKQVSEMYPHLLKRPGLEGEKQN